MNIKNEINQRSQTNVQSEVTTKEAETHLESIRAKKKMALDAPVKEGKLYRSKISDTALLNAVKQILDCSDSN